MVSMVLVLSLAIRTAEFVFYHLLLSLVDHVSGLPRDNDGAGGDAPLSGEHRPQGTTRGTRATSRQGGDQTKARLPRGPGGAGDDRAADEVDGFVAGDGDAGAA